MSQSPISLFALQGIFQEGKIHLVPGPILELGQRSHADCKTCRWDHETNKQGDDGFMGKVQAFRKKADAKMVEKAVPSDPSKV